MNIKSLQKLKSVSKNLSILYIESDLNLQHKISSYLRKAFKNVYQAYDGYEGFVKYKKFQPDIIITDSVLSKKNTTEMVVDIKELDEKIPIIVLGYKSDEYLLLELLDIEQLKLLEKPLDFDKLNQCLIDSLPKKKIDPISKKCFEDLEKILNKNVPFINNYKGIVLQNNEKVVVVNENSFFIKVSKVQFFAIRSQRYTIIECDKKYIMAYLVNIKNNNVLELARPKYITYKPRDDNNKRLLVDKSFKIGLFYNNEHLELAGIDVSFVSISMYIKNDKIKFDLNSKIDLTLGFDLNGPGSLVHEKKFIKIFSSATITRVDKYKEGLKIVAELQVKKSGVNTFSKYLSQRELEIVNEIKNKIK